MDLNIEVFGLNPKEMVPYDAADQPGLTTRVRHRSADGVDDGWNAQQGLLR